VSELRRFLHPALVLTALLAVDVVFQPVPFGLAFRAWLVALGALAAAALVRGSLAPYQQVHVKPVRLRTRRQVHPERPAGLEEVERAIDFAVWNPADLKHRLRPLLREVAAHRLRNRRGADIDRQPELARRLLGEVAWDLIQGPPGPEPEPARTGASVVAIRETIQRLEDLQPR
jgi:hypothetical protein